MTGKRVLIVFALSGERKKIHKALSRVFSDRFGIVCVSEYGSQDSISRDMFCRNFHEIVSGSERIYFASDGLMPLTDRPDEVLAFMENGTETRSLWSYSDIYGDLKCVSCEDFPFLLCVCTASDDFKAISGKLAVADTLKALCAMLCGYISEESFFSVLTRSNELTGKKKIPFAFNAEEYLEMGFPFYAYGLFKLERMDFIKYGTDNVPSEVFGRLMSNREIAECLPEYFAEECDASRLKTLLGLNFIVSENQSGALPSRGKSAVFVHMYYECYFERYIGYLNAAADFCDVFISVNTEEKRSRLMSMAGGALRDRLTVVICENRGRDLSALLVAFRPYTVRYEYFCFLHDKSPHEYEAETVGQAFSDCIWDNLLGEGTIPGIISFLEENPYIGLLVPPTPYWGVYLELKGDFWTVCYDKTLELSKRLGLSVKINGQIDPAALGTAFWCRTEALFPLLEYPWRYGDFDEEPLNIDGTISHALERILPYAALDRHFLTSWIISEKFVPRILESHLYLTERYMRSLRQSPIPSAAGKTAEQIGVRGALCALKEAMTLLFGSLGAFFKRRISKKERKCKR